MIDSTLPVCDAVVAAQRGDAALVALVGQRAFDRPSAKKALVFPYTSLGPVDGVEDADDCHGGWAVTVQVDVWSRAVGSVEAKEILRRLVQVLNQALEVDGHQVVTWRLERTGVTADPDGLTTHGYLQITYVTAPLAGG